MPIRDYHIAVIKRAKKKKKITKIQIEKGERERARNVLI